MRMLEHGWYSEEQARRVGAVLFRTLDGGVVECSLVTMTLEEGLGVGFADMEYRGEVDSFLRRLRPGRGHGVWKYMEEAGRGAAVARVVGDHEVAGSIPVALTK